jgi:hypothetical protein
MCAIQLASTLWCRDQDLFGDSSNIFDMTDEQSEESLQLEINKEIEKLKYYVGNANETIKEGDFLKKQQEMCDSAKRKLRKFISH